MGWTVGYLTPVDCMSAHDPEQAADTLRTRYKAHCSQQVHHRFYALGRVLGQVTIHDIHHLDVLGFFRSWLVIHLAAVDGQKLTLFADRDFQYPGLNQLCPQISIPSFLQLFFKKSFSTFNWPICA